MKNYLLGALSCLLMTGCFAGSASSDISLDHRFDLQFTADNTATLQTVQQCYIPNVSSTFTDLQSNDPNLSWKITNLKDVIDMGKSQVDVYTMNIAIESGDDQIVLFGAPDPKNPNHYDLNNNHIDNDALQRILNSNTMQICLEVTGQVMADSTVAFNNSISFNLELDYTHKLIRK